MNGAEIRKIKQRSTESTLDFRVRQVVGFVPFHAWMKGVPARDAGLVSITAQGGGLDRLRVSPAIMNTNDVALAGRTKTQDGPSRAPC